MLGAKHYQTSWTCVNLRPVVHQYPNNPLTLSKVLVAKPWAASPTEVGVEVEQWSWKGNRFCKRLSRLYPCPASKLLPYFALSKWTSAPWSTSSCTTCDRWWHVAAYRAWPPSPSSLLMSTPYPSSMQTLPSKPAAQAWDSSEGDTDTRGSSRKSKISSSGWRMRQIERHYRWILPCQYQTALLVGIR